MNLTTASDEFLAEKLRRENCDQFNTLVRMHLSFVLDLNTDESDCVVEKSKLKKWSFVPFKKTKYGKGIMDGVPLTQEGICQVYQLIEFLKREPNILVEGIFRRTGSLARQQELKNILNQGTTLCIEGRPYSVHDCASVLKGFLAELPEPLLTDAHYPAYCQIAELYASWEKQTRDARLLRSLQLLLLLLPIENRSLLKDVIQLLHKTASHENSNKMSADSLATLFTPHLLCPRKLSPENLHVDSQTLSGIISFMITKYTELFLIPHQLALDIRAYILGIERRRILSPQKEFNESVNDGFAAKTVFSFVDRERTAKENQANQTETALAELYAHIQSLPESSKKRKLVKQFNKENGQGTPLQFLQSNVQKNRTIGDSIKKHIFHKSLMKPIKRVGFAQVRSSSEEMLNETMMTPRSRKPVLLVSGTNLNKLPKLETQDCNMDSVLEESSSSSNTELEQIKKSKSDSDLIESTSSMRENSQSGARESLSSTFKEYLNTRSMKTDSPTDSSFASCTDDYCSADIKDLSASKLSTSLLHCLDGNTPHDSPASSEKITNCDGNPESDKDDEEKVLVLRPKQFDENGLPIVYETSF